MGHCLKCGKKADEPSAFCNECLSVMERYPVKPGTAIHLPIRKPSQEAATPTDFDEASQAKQISSQQTLIRWLTATVAGLSILLVITAVMLIQTLEKETALPTIGRNYTTSTTANKP